MKIRFVLCAVAAFIRMNTVSAFDILPEYHTLSEAEQASFDRPQIIDSEYQSDVLTFLPSPLMNLLWASQDRTFDMTVGSLTGEHFFFYDRLKLNADLTDRLQFRLLAFRQQDFEIDEVHEILELLYRLNDQWVVLAYGEPSFYKRQTDFGAGLIYQLGLNHQVRFFNTFTDITRPAHNDQPDKFERPYLPMSTGFVGRRIELAEAGKDGDFLDYTFRYDHKTIWLFPVEGYRYTYWKKLLQLNWRKFITRHQALNLRLQFDQKLESRSPTTTASTISDETWLRERLFSVVTFQTPVAESDWVTEAGFGYFYRHWRTDNGLFATHHNFLPHAWLTIPVPTSRSQPDRLKIGYEVTFFNSQGTEPLRAPAPRDEAIEQRLNLRYEFALADNAALSFLVSADVDDFGTGQSFEGGNGQFRVDF